MSLAAEEQTLIDKAQSFCAIEDDRAYVASYPDSVYAELASPEIESIRAKQTASTAKNAEEKPKEIGAVIIQTPAFTTSSFGTVSFDAPLTVGSDAILGKSIANLVTGSPLFPPNERLPEAAD